MVSLPSPFDQPAAGGTATTAARGGTEPTPPHRLRGKHLPWLALFTGLATVLNATPLPLYFGVHLMLGSALPTLALLLWRTWWAVPMALIASLQTLVLWGHPWAVVIFGLEMLWLTLAMRRCNGPASNDGNGRVVLFSITYWLLLGCPLVLLFYGGVMGIDPANLAVVMVKQAFNGVFNTVLAFGALILIQALRSGRNHGPGVSLRGVIMALVLMAVTLPTLLISLTAGHQLELAVERGALDGLRTVNLALSRASSGGTASDQNTQLLMEQLGKGMDYRRIEASGRVLSSDPALFRRLDSTFLDGGRSSVHDPELSILIPRAKGPNLRKWVNGYWTYSRQYGNQANGGTYLVQVVEPARTIVMRLQQQSATLLSVSCAVLVIGALISLQVGRWFEQEFRQVLHPLDQEGDLLHPLQLSSVLELRSMAQLINHRIQQVGRLSLKLRQANDNLRRSRTELKGLLTCDPVTGCGNQDALQRRLREEVDRCSRSGEALSCLVIDVEALPSIKREQGRAAVEALLLGLAEAARKRLRRTDHLYHPLPQQFVVLAIGCPHDQAEQVGQQLQAAMAAVHLSGSGTAVGHGSIEVRSALSLGISSLEPGQDSGESLLLRARSALLSARGQAEAGTH